MICKYCGSKHSSGGICQQCKVKLRLIRQIKAMLKPREIPVVVEQAKPKYESDTRETFQEILEYRDRVLKKRGVIR